MPAYAKPDYSNTCAALTRAIQDLQVRIRVSEQNTKLMVTYDENITKLQNNVAICNKVIDVIKPLAMDTTDYIAKKRREALQNINNALRLAGEIIQDSTEGIFFNVDGEDAWLSTPDGLEVDLVEGGGYRQISSTFIRSVVLAANNNTLNTMFLDEIFSLVSPENSAALSLYLNIICQDMQVISIEQKPQVYSNISHVRYLFNKIGEYTTISKSIVTRDISVKEDANESKAS